MACTARKNLQKAIAADKITQEKISANSGAIEQLASTKVRIGDVQSLRKTSEAHPMQHACRPLAPGSIQEELEASLPVATSNAAGVLATPQFAAMKA